MFVAGTPPYRWHHDLPAWWVIPSWVAMIAYSVVVSHHHDLAVRIAVGVLMTVAAAGVQFTTVQTPERPRLIGVLTATVCGLAVIVLVSSGLGYVPVLVAAARFPYGGRPGAVWMVADTIAFGTAVAIGSRSVTAAIAGVGIPLLIQRAAQQREIVRQRDEARALLVEVQAGREAEAQAAALRERGRIAREMHDVLAHSLAGLSLQLQAIRAVAARTEAGPELTEPLDRAAQLARDGLSEARGAVSTLRDPSGLGLGLDGLPALVERQPGGATLRVLGEPGSVAPAAGHAVYRAVQEALTNAARYAPGATIGVELQWTPAELALQVTDTGPATGHHTTPGQGSGLGLAGMSERLEPLGGSVQAGPRPDGPGWRVQLRVPATAAESS
jgi:signal transduction histidine kinase